MRNAVLTVLALACLALPACGMNRAVGVLPNTLEDLEQARGGPDGATPADQAAGRGG